MDQERIAPRYLAPRKPILKGPRIAVRYLVGDVPEGAKLPLELAKPVAKHYAAHEDIFFIKHDGEYYLIRPLNVKEYMLLTTLRRWFDPSLGFPDPDRAGLKEIAVEDIFGDCILYPEDLDTREIAAGVQNMLVSSAIEVSGWDDKDDILIAQGEGRRDLSENFITHIITFVRRAHPSLTEESLYNSNILRLMRLLAASEAIMKEPFEIKEREEEGADAKKIANKVAIREDMKAMRKMGIPGSRPK